MRETGDRYLFSPDPQQFAVPAESHEGLDSTASRTSCTHVEWPGLGPRCHGRGCGHALSCARLFSGRVCMLLHGSA